MQKPRDTCNVSRSGGTYFVSALSTKNSMKAKLLLKLNADDVLKLDTDAGHSCAK